MIEVLFIQIPAGANRDKMFVGLRSVVSKECCAEVLGYGNKEVALRRLLGEALVRFALKKYWNLTSEDYRIDRGEKGKPFIVGVENVFFNISHSVCDCSLPFSLQIHQAVLYIYHTLSHQSKTHYDTVQLALMSL